MKDEIYAQIVILADRSLQRKLWLNQNNDTGLVSSYTELMCSLFDDYCVEDFVADPSESRTISNSAKVHLKVLINLLKEYVEQETDERIIEDPNWMKIVEQATITLQNWS